MRAPTPSLVLLASLVVGCSPQPGDRDTSPPQCADGTIADGDDCVPEACGAGIWGDLPVGDGDVYVSVEAADGGDGSVDAPLRSIQAGLDLAGARGGGLVAVAAGSYPETLELTADHAGVHLAGRCRDLVTLDVGVGDETTAGIFIEVVYAEVELSGLSVVGSSYYGLWMRSGSVRLVDSVVVGSASFGIAGDRGSLTAPTVLELEGCEIVESTSVGLLALEAGTQISLVDTVVRDTRSDGNGLGGYGVQVYLGAEVATEGGEIAGNASAGVFAVGSGSRITLADTVVRDTRPDGDGDYGFGLQAKDGAVLEADGCDILENAASGIMASDAGTGVALVNTTVRDTLPDGGGDGGFGIGIIDGATLRVEGCVVAGNMAVGIGVEDSGTLATLEDTLVRDTRSNTEGDGGFGIQISDGATLSARRCEVAGNMAEGIRASGTGTVVALVDTLVRDTLPNGNDEGGYGIDVLGGASLTARGCEVAGNIARGINTQGQGTQVALLDSVIRENLPDEGGERGLGIDVSDGAVLTAAGCDVVGNTTVGIMAHDPGTQVTLEDTVVLETRSNGDDEFGFGIQVSDGAVLRAGGCEVAENTWLGIKAGEPGTEVILADTIVRDTLPSGPGEGGYGVQVSDGARLYADGCITSGNTAVGILVGDASTEVTLVDTVVGDTHPDAYWGSGYGIEVDGGAMLLAEDCEIFANTVVGVAASNPGTQVALVDTVIRDTLPEEGGGKGFGLLVTDGATMTAEGCGFTENMAAGILVSRSGTQAVLRDSTISGTTAGFDETGMTAVGLSVQLGAAVTASGLLALDNDGPGLYSVSAGSSLSCTGCTLHSNRFAGAVATAGGALEISESEITDTLQSANLGGGVGVFAARQWDEDPPSLVVSDSSIEDNFVAGAWLAGSGSYVLEGNRITSSTAIPHGSTDRCGDGVYAAGTEAWDGLEGLLLSGNTLSDNQGGGVFLDNALAQLSSNTWSGNDPDLWVQGAACLSPRDDWTEAPESEICPEWSRPVCDLEFVLNLGTADLDPARARPHGVARTLPLPHHLHTPAPSVPPLGW